MRPVEVILATENPGKVREYERLLAGLPVVVRSLAELSGYEAPPEDGETFEDNARIKAAAAAAAAGLPALADDSGLCVDALGGAPGVHSARYGGPGASDADRRHKLLGALAEVPDEARTAAFECVIALAQPDGRLATISGRCAGRILREERGESGFGYDPVFVPDGHTRTFAELPADEKDRLSHRGRAAVGLPALVDWLRP